MLAVIDRDKAIDLWQPGRRPSDCMSGISDTLHQEAQGEYELVFLQRNMETLVEVVCRVMRYELPERKPTPDERDRLLARAVWTGTSEDRAKIRSDCPSFDRIVTRTASALRIHMRPA